jgi:hypothetical protein
MRTGSRSGYWVIEWSDGYDAALEEIISLCPQIVLDQYVAIVSCDSGPYKPTAEELIDGWKTVGDLAVSPRIRIASTLPMPNFDEWYIYDRNIDLGVHRAFVNHGGFAPLNEGDSLTDGFWAQIERLKPDHVVGAGTPTLFLVTRDKEIYRSACALGPDY